MPSKRFLHQSILFTIPFNVHPPHWTLLGGQGAFCLPYLRRQQELGHPVDLRAQINTLEDLRGAFYLWEGSPYVEFHDSETLLTAPTRIEWSGTIRPAALSEISPFLLPEQDNIGPIEQTSRPSTTP